jgi:hypothetical protein
MMTGLKVSDQQSCVRSCLRMVRILKWTMRKLMRVHPEVEMLEGSKFEELPEIKTIT